MEQTLLDGRAAGSDLEVKGLAKEHLSMTHGQVLWYGDGLRNGWGWVEVDKGKNAGVTNSINNKNKKLKKNKNILILIL